MISSEFKRIGNRILRASNKNATIFQTIQSNYHQHEALYSTKAFFSNQSLTRTSARNTSPSIGLRRFSTLDHPASSIFDRVTPEEPSQKKKFQILSPAVVEMIKRDFKVCGIISSTYMFLQSPTYLRSPLRSALYIERLSMSTTMGKWMPTN